MKELGTLLRTIKDLTKRQIFFQIKKRILTYPFKANIKGSYNLANLNSFKYIAPLKGIYTSKYKFNFLNIQDKFSNQIHWNEDRHGKLWAYNLNYLDLLNCPHTSEEDKHEVLKLFYQNYTRSGIIIGKEPYPVSLRIINLVKYLANNQNNDLARSLLVEDTFLLLNNIEYHLGANHVLENALALWFASYFIKSSTLQIKSNHLLQSELKEQIFQDGAHYELSPMYHLIILGRILEAISLDKNNPNEHNEKVVQLLKITAKKMLNWIYTITNGFKFFPQINDSSEMLVPDLKNICSLSQYLGLKPQKIQLDDSRLRIFETKEFFALFDFSEISPKYQPGHAHADTFNILLYTKENLPVLVDPGISTYENNSSRKLERSTEYHNTVSVSSLNNNEVWGVFRTGRKAKVTTYCDENSRIEVSHNGYGNIGLIHKRRLVINENELYLTDQIFGKSTKFQLYANFHFHPNIKICQANENEIILNNGINLYFMGAYKIHLKKYEYCLGFNQHLKAIKAQIFFCNKLDTIIQF